MDRRSEAKRMGNRQYYDALLSGMNDSDLTVKKIVHGISWTAAVLSNGNAGVAMHTEGETRPRRQGGLEGMPVLQAAESVLSWNMEEANEGMAVINAFYNSPENLARHEKKSGQKLPVGGALDGIDLKGKTLAMIGHLLGHSGIREDLLSQCSEYYVLEREPREGDYPDSACEYILPQCDIVIITGSASMNKTMPRLLELAENAEVILTGPSVPMCPELFSLGITRLYGVIIQDVDAMCRGIVEAKGSVNRYSGRFCLDMGIL